MNNYSLPYLIFAFVFLLLFILEVKFPKKREIIGKYCSMFFLFLFGFRGLIGSDWINYQVTFEYLGSSILYDTENELGFRMLIKFVKSIGLNFNYFVLVITTIQVFLLHRLLTLYSKYYSLAYLIILALFPIVFIDLLRNFTAMLIVLNGLPYLEKGNKKVFFLFIIGGMLFHISSIVFFSMFFLNKKLPTQNVLKILFFVGIIIYSLQINFFSVGLEFIGKIVGGRIEYLIEQAVGKEEKSYGISFGILEKLFIFCCLIVGFDKLKVSNRIFVNSLVVYLSIYLFFSTSQSFINRFSTLFIFGYIIILCDFFYYYKSRFKINIALLFFLLFLSLRIFIGYNEGLYDYSNWLFVEDDFNQRVLLRETHYNNRDL